MSAEANPEVVAGTAVLLVADAVRTTASAEPVAVARTAALFADDEVATSPSPSSEVASTPFALPCEPLPRTPAVPLPVDGPTTASEWSAPAYSAYPEPGLTARSVCDKLADSSPVTLPPRRQA